MDEKALVGRLWLDVTNVMASNPKRKKIDFWLPSVAHERLCLSSLICLPHWWSLNIPRGRRTSAAKVFKGKYEVERVWKGGGGRGGPN